ncbi:hypothetical protein PMm318_A22160 [Pseudomonas moorei]
MARLGVGPLAQPVARRATRPHANHYKTGQTTEYLSTGKGHVLNYLTYQLRALGPQKANTIHLQLRNSKGDVWPHIRRGHNHVVHMPWVNGASCAPVFSRKESA